MKFIEKDWTLEMMDRIEIPPGLDTRVFLTDRGALSALPEILRDFFSGCPAQLVADPRTWKAAGEKTLAILTGEGYPVKGVHLLTDFPLHSDEKYSPELRSLLTENTAPIAVGGGTVNDLVKRASTLSGVRYCCVPTAASVDGYTSYGSAMLVEQVKQTLPGNAPLAIVADTDVLHAAPAELNRAGYADLFAKIPAGGDWIIADELSIQNIDPVAWSMVQDSLRDFLRDPADSGKVFRGLAASGFAMQYYRESRPASGAEHLFSHLWELEDLRTPLGNEPLHGEKVAVGTLLSTLLMESAFHMTAEEAARLALPPPTGEEREAEMDELLRNCVIADAARKIAGEKFLPPAQMMERRKQILIHWENLRTRVLKQIYPAEECRRMLRKAGCPVCPDEIGLSRESLRLSIPRTQLIRKRYTILDLLYEAGLLAAATERALNQLYENKEFFA